MAARSDDPDVLLGLLDHGPYIAALIAPDGEILWVSDEGVRRVFGYEAEEVIGTNFLEHLDLAKSDTALQTVADALTQQGLRLPTYFSARRKDGSETIVEVWANSQLHNPRLGALVAYIRPWDEQRHVDAALETLARAEPLDATCRLLVQAMTCETLDATACVLHTAHVGRFAAGTAHEALAPELVGIGDLTDGAPWQRAIEARRPVFLEVADLPEPLRASAIAAGFSIVWVWPMLSPLHEVTGCVVAWRTDDQLEPDPSRADFLDRLAAIAALAVERSESLATLRRAATEDALTGVANRAEFYNGLAHALELGLRPVAVCYLDLDGFKPINDEHGHATGDDVLIAVADRLRGAVRAGDVVARLGGDEFAVLSTAVATLDELEALAARLVASVVEPIAVGDLEVQIGVSIGAVLVPAGSRDPDALVEAADAAMYEVKTSGKGGWHIVTVA